MTVKKPKAAAKKKAPAKKKPPKDSKPADGFSMKIIEGVCSHLEKGVTLVDICKREEFPSVRTIYNWMDKYPEAAASIARARDAGYDVIANSCLEIADETSCDIIDDGNGRERINTEAVQRSKLRIWTRLELLKKWDPKRYGDSLKVDADVKISRADEIRKARERAAKK